MQNNLANLLEQQRVYWRQRGTIKWATLGDENTATVKHSKNCIRSLQDNNGIENFQHEEKASFLWEAFRERLGHSEFREMHFDLNSLLQPINGLEDLVNPSTNDEVDVVVKNLKADKSQGLDGFNTDFMKNVGMSLSMTSIICAQASIIMILVCRSSVALTSL
jgi:hypothetical protein